MCGTPHSSRMISTSACRPGSEMVPSIRARDSRAIVAKLCCCPSMGACTAHASTRHTSALRRDVVFMIRPWSSRNARFHVREREATCTSPGPPTRAGAIVRPGGGWKMQRRPPPSADGAPSRADRRRLLLDRRRGAVRLDRFDPCIAGGRRCVHLARADDLAVRRLQVEILLAVRRGLALVARVVAAVLLHRGNAVLRGRLRVVRLTPQDRLAVAGLEDEGVLPLVVLAEHVPSGHECLPVA